MVTYARRVVAFLSLVILASAALAQPAADGVSRRRASGPRPRLPAGPDDVFVQCNKIS